MNALARTPAEHREFLAEIIKLSLFFASEYHRKTPAEDINSIIIKRKNLELEYKPKAAWCSFASMRDHLKVFLK